jgi:hypothetical protein
MKTRPSSKQNVRHFEIHVFAEPPRKICQSTIQVPQSQGGKVIWKDGPCEGTARPGSKHCLFHQVQAEQSAFPATNEEIDAYVLRYVQDQKKQEPKERIPLNGITFALQCHFHNRLPQTGKKHLHLPKEWANATVVANRACQRLRKAGKLTFHPTRKWEPTKTK